MKTESIVQNRRKSPKLFGSNIDFSFMIDLNSFAIWFKFQIFKMAQFENRTKLLSIAMYHKLPVIKLNILKEAFSIKSKYLFYNWEAHFIASLYNPFISLH